MTKRAWIIIGILILVPVLVTGIALMKWKKANPVVAAYGDSVEEVHFGDKILYAVGDADSYMAEPGGFLGKVQDPVTGAALYTVKYDKTGEIWALVTEKGTVLYSESGELPASAFGGTQVSAVFFDTFAHRTAERNETVLLESVPKITEEPLLWQPSEKDAPDIYRMHYCFNGCAVSTVSPGQLLYFHDSGLWYFLPAAEEELVKTQTETGEVAAGKEVYRVLPVTDRTVLNLLKALLRGEDT